MWGKMNSEKKIDELFGQADIGHFIENLSEMIKNSNQFHEEVKKAHSFNEDELNFHFNSSSR